MKSVDHMFYIPIFHFKVERWEDKKKKLLELWNSVASSCREEDNLFFNYESNSSIVDNYIHEIFYEEIKSFVISIGYDHYQFLNAWFENAKRGGNHEIHNHGPIGYSSVCFINYNKDVHTPTQFISPFNDFINGRVITYSPENISEGSILFFPSNTSHYTNPNLSNFERLVVSFNLAIERKVMEV
jgi:hypothetical protein